MLLNATPGSATANSYATVAEALDLLSESLFPDIALSDVQYRLNDALIWATRMIEEQVLWYGAPVSATQALAWPQAASTLLGRALSTTAIPAFLQQATAEYALAIIRDVLRREALVTSPMTAGLQGVRAIAIDDVRITLANDLAQQAEALPSTYRMPDAVRRILTPYGDVAGNCTVRLVPV
jgi:hypothetical protein